MFPFDKKDRKRGIFGDFDVLFGEFEDYTQKILEQAAKSQGQNFIYSYRAYTGPDGKPIVEEYSNIPGFKGRFGEIQRDDIPQSCVAPTEQIDSIVEPYHDVLDEGEKVKIIVEMPCVEKKDIKLKTTGRHLSVKAKSSYHNYVAAIQLPDYIEAKPQKAEYKNGVLEVIYKKSNPEDIKLN